MLDASTQKDRLRQQYLANRDAIGNRVEKNAKILSRISNWLTLQPATTLLCYVSARSEVETGPLLTKLLTGGQRLVVPYCLNDKRLGLFLLSELAELTPGRFGILEPRTELRDSKAISPGEIELAILPGVSFDLQGNRLGYGKGYFDRLLGDIPPQATTCALAYECQISPKIPVEPHDLPIQVLITEDRLIQIAAAP